MRKSIVVIVVIALLVVAMTVNAKYEPYMEDEDWGGVGDTTSAAWEAPAALPFYGLYGHLTEGDVDAFVYEFEDAVTAFSLQVTVPQCGDLLVDFYPSIALIGPGLDAPDADLELPFDLPEGAGVQVFVEEEQPRSRIIDGNSGYVRRGYVSTWWSVDIPEAGEYMVAVWEPNDRVGAYALATGRENPDYMDNDRTREQERIRIYSMIEGDTWIELDCDADLG